MRLKINKRQTHPRVITLTLEGTLDGETRILLDSDAEIILNEAIKILVIDMQGVDFITSSGVGAIIEAKVSLYNEGADLILVNLQPQVEKIFEIIGLLAQIGVFQERDELDEYLSGIL